MTPEQEKSIIFNVMLKTNPGLSGGDWVEVASKVGLGHEIVRSPSNPANPSPPPSATMDPNIYLLMRMLQSHSPGLAGANWKQIAAEMNQHQGTLKKKFAAMRKEFLENQTSKGAAGSPAAAAPASKKRGRATKAAEPVDAEDDDAELDGTPAKRQRRGRPSNNGKTTAAEVEAGSEKGDDDEV